VATAAFRAREFPPWQGTCWSPAVSTVKPTLPVGVPAWSGACWLSGSVHKVPAALAKVTVPVAVPEPGDAVVTVAVKVTVPVGVASPKALLVVSGVRFRLLGPMLTVLTPFG
jgi:hypothetical protein